MSEPLSMSPDEEPDHPVTVTVLHGGFDVAAYAVMIGVYADEEMSGAERYLDGQFSDLLSDWRDLNRYPGPLGTSAFITPGRDVDERCEPVGAYLVGLGSALTLDRRRIGFAVRRALVDRCLHLYPPVDRHAVPEGGGVAVPAADPLVVGVSSALLGVRDDESLRVEDAVAGILEGVRDANRDLARFERGRGTPARVRVGALEFVERYVHRADLAAAAVRRARVAVQLPDTYGDFDQVCVTTGDGALPAGAALLERGRTWQRFVITEQRASDPRRPSASSAGSSSGPLVLEVSALAREALADRMTHRIDRASLVALVDRVSRIRTDAEALQTLRDRLVPRSMRAEFLTAPAVQLVVDAATANYPWELLVSPLPGAPVGNQPTGTRAVLRMFADTGSGRLQPDRAHRGNALVIGAGNVEPHPPLPGAVEEAKTVHALLKRCGLASGEPLTDDTGPLDVATLNIELCGDHQILHLACHGIHVDDDRDATGAVLTSDLLFTADLVESMPVVPELVMINSCSNARIGVNPLAAGLARALMGIGVRAVVAAGWPIGDAAATRFATTFYTALTEGRMFGDAVTEARGKTIRSDDPTTWAAYQCYGDPEFVLRGPATPVSSRSVPVGLADLKARLGTLLVQTADLSRPRPKAVRERRGWLLDTFNDLQTWARAQQHDKDRAEGHNVRRLLALAARELGDFRSAADWYRTFIDESPGHEPRLGQARSCVLDLQQAANCLARSAQQVAREAKDEDVRLPALALFSTAERLAKAATDALPDDEGRSILASVHKKWATVDPEARDDHVRAAIAAYEQIESHTPGGYGVENGIQVIAVRDVEEARRRFDQLVPEVARPLLPSRLVDAAPVRRPDFWGRAADGDRALTQLMLSQDEGAQVAATDALIVAYRDACSHRSTFSERGSVVDHLRDLLEILPDPDPRKRHLRRAYQDLKPWADFEVATAGPSPSGASRRAASTGLPRGGVGVRVTAVPAACGDCLFLEYAGDDGPHRVLVDGGLGAAFDTGLGQLLGAPGSPTRVDVAVVTHVDSDHLEGIHRALREGRLDAADFWFNGREQLARLLEPPGARSTRQGDALSGLLPDDRRNLAVGRDALVVPDAGPRTVALPGGATAVLLSPSRRRLQDLFARWPALRRDGGATDQEGLDDLLDALADPVERGPGVFGRDHGVANGSSIAFLFEHAGTSILFTGDAYESELAASIEKLVHDRGVETLHVQLFKLPHHGSRQNVTDTLLSLIDPEEILVCTDGSKFSHPDEDALLKVRERYGAARIYFTDDTEVTRARAARVGGLLPSSLPVTIDLSRPPDPPAPA